MKFILILGIDTAAKTSCVALAYADLESPKFNISTLSEVYSGGNIPHSENLCPMIDRALETAGATLSDVNLFAVAAGPGSFTGIRIGISTVKGLAYGADCNCIGVSSLQALAYNFRGFGGFGGEKIYVAPAIDARRKQIYNAVFGLSEGRLEYIKSDRIITVKNFEEELNGGEYDGGVIIFTGDGADMCRGEIKLRGTVKKSAGDILNRTNGSSVCAAAAAEILRGTKTVHPRTLAPSYLIKTQAERELGQTGASC